MSRTSQTCIPNQKRLALTSSKHAQSRRCKYTKIMRLQYRQAELWSLDSCTPMWQSKVQGWMGIYHVVFSPQDDLIAFGGDSRLALLNAVSGETVFEQSKWIGGQRWHCQYSHLTSAADGTQLLTSVIIDGRGRAYVWGVTSGISSKAVHLLFEFDTSHRTTVCSFFDNHRYIATDYGLFPISPQHRPSCAADDLVPPEILLRLREDGWIWLVGGKRERRVCWLPPAFRSASPVLNKNIVTLRDSIRLVTDSGRIVVLDLKKWFQYANIS
jgi:hypothetical protein